MRHSTAFSRSARLFIVLGSVEECEIKCDEANQCLGVFVWFSEAGVRCYGLSDLGFPVKTNTNSVSLARVDPPTTVGVTEQITATTTTTTPPTSSSTTTTVAATASTTLTTSTTSASDGYELVHAGQVEGNDAGPFYRFAQSFESSNQLFRTFSVSDCHLRCDTIDTCMGIFEFTNKQSGKFSCYGLQDISGTPVPTNSRSRSLKKLEGKSDDFATFTVVYTGKLSDETKGLRFSTAFSLEARLFDVDAKAMCVEKCSIMKDCLGYFLWSGGKRCFGLSNLGVATATGVPSSSYKKDTALPVAYEVVAKGLSIDSPNGDATGFRFSTAFSSSARLFVETILAECTDLCDLEEECVGVYNWQSGGQCYGLSDLGKLVRTKQVGISYRKPLRKL